MGTRRASKSRAGLRCVQGKGVVNSLSLKEGEAEFLRQHSSCVATAPPSSSWLRRASQADTASARRRCSRRAYRLWSTRRGSCPKTSSSRSEHFRVATGSGRALGYARDTIEAVREIKRSLPYALVSGGVSKFPSPPRQRSGARSMHAFPLSRDPRRMDLGIVNAGPLGIRRDHSRASRARGRRDPGAEFGCTERLVEIAERYRTGAAEKPEADLAWRSWAGAQATRERARPRHHRNGSRPTPRTATGRRAGRCTSRRSAHDGNERRRRPLARKMFLPQVVKSARVMKKAVAISSSTCRRTRPRVPRARRQDRLATSRRVTRHRQEHRRVCSSATTTRSSISASWCRVRDPRNGARLGCHAIGLSGLITPSMDEMVHVGGDGTPGLKTPLLIGGATTSNCTPR